MPSAEEGTASLSFLRYEQLYPTPNDELEDFFQTWLFFGLIHEFMGELCNRETFFRKFDDGKVVLSTSALPDIVSQWAASIKCGSSSLSYDHVAQCLHRVVTTLRAAGPAFDPNIELSIASLGELLEFAANEAFDTKDLTVDNKCPGSWSGMIEDDYWLGPMQESRWCPSQIKVILDASGSLQARHFFANLDPAEPFIAHDNCDGNKCVRLQNDLTTYKTRHLTSECCCDELLVDAKRLDEVLMSGSLPLLDITEGQSLSELSVSIVPSTSSTPWVALSHVWADGLGNPVDNALPRCQLQRLKQLIRTLVSTSNENEDSPEALLWVDTLCCPVAPEGAKNRALTEMKRTYQQATYVLVIESTLQAFVSETMTLEETCARISVSGWMRRLWTLQEGALPARDRRLWFQFRDKAISFYSLWQALRRTINLGFRQWGLAVDLINRMATFTAWSPRSSRDDGPDLAIIDEALQFRSVSVPSDEPLLLGNLLGLDVRKILDGSEDTRMHRLWSLMPSALRGIPKGILFRLGPRLEEDGYRWAPATMIGSEKSNKMLSAQLGGYDEGKPTGRGLLVQLAGFKISMAERLDDLPQNLWKLAPQQMQSLYVRDQEGSWYLVLRRIPTVEGDFLSSSRLENFLQSNGDVWVAHAETDSQLLASGQASTAIMVKLVEDSADVMYVRSEMHVNVLPVPHSLQRLMAAAYQCACEMINDPVVVQLRSKSYENVERAEPACESFSDAIEPEIHHFDQHWNNVMYFSLHLCFDLLAVNLLPSVVLVRGAKTSSNASFNAEGTSPLFAIVPPVLIGDTDAITAITQGLSLYGLAIDTKNFTALEGAFTDDMVANVPPVPVIGLANYESFLAEDLVPLKTQHITSNVFVYNIRERTARSTSYQQAVHIGSGNLLGQIVTFYERFDDVWRRDLIDVSRRKPRYLDTIRKGKLGKRRIDTSCLLKDAGEEGYL
ncbi:hypothetical protein G7Y79_00071g097450 [Physcia stellaris]|nr:hypothetical protein G7Y79_00071g097450 [Physcia stellaris]